MGQIKLEACNAKEARISVIQSVKFNIDGLIPCIAVDFQTKVVLMQAYMNQESLVKTLETGEVTYFSRSRQSLWKKGETSGNLQKLRALYLDCDQDAILVEVEQIGAACHVSTKSCFYEDQILNNFSSEILRNLQKTIKDRKLNPVEGSYTNYLLDKGIDKILKKIGEEATEVVIGAKNNSEEVIYETADLLYHLLVLYECLDVDFDKVFKELNERNVHK